MANHLKYLDFAGLSKFNETVNQRLYKRLKYMGELELNADTRVDWSDIAPCTIGHMYVLTGTQGDKVVINDIEYSVGDTIYAINDVNGTDVPATTVQVNKISAGGKVFEYVEELPTDKIDDQKIYGVLSTKEDYELQANERYIKIPNAFVSFTLLDKNGNFRSSFNGGAEGEYNIANLSPATQSDGSIDWFITSPGQGSYVVLRTSATPSDMIAQIGTDNKITTLNKTTDVLFDKIRYFAYNKEYEVWTPLQSGDIYEFVDVLPTTDIDDQKIYVKRIQKPKKIDDLGINERFVIATDFEVLDPEGTIIRKKTPTGDYQVFKLSELTLVRYGAADINAVCSDGHGGSWLIFTTSDTPDPNSHTIVLKYNQTGYYDFHALYIKDYDAEYDGRLPAEYWAYDSDLNKWTMLNDCKPNIEYVTEFPSQPKQNVIYGIRSTPDPLGDNEFYAMLNHDVFTSFEILDSKGKLYKMKTKANEEGTAWFYQTDMRTRDDGSVGPRFFVRNIPDPWPLLKTDADHAEYIVTTISPRAGWEYVDHIRKINVEQSGKTADEVMYWLYDYHGETWTCLNAKAEDAIIYVDELPTEDILGNVIYGVRKQTDNITGGGADADIGEGVTRSYAYPQTSTTDGPDVFIDFPNDGQIYVERTLYGDSYTVNISDVQLIAGNGAIGFYTGNVDHPFIQFLQVTSSNDKDPFIIEYGPADELTGRAPLYKIMYADQYVHNTKTEYWTYDRKEATWHRFITDIIEPIDELPQMGVDTQKIYTITQSDGLIERDKADDEVYLYPHPAETIRVKSDYKVITLENDTEEHWLSDLKRDFVSIPVVAGMVYCWYLQNDDGSKRYIFYESPIAIGQAPEYVAKVSSDATYLEYVKPLKEQTFTNRYYIYDKATDKWTMLNGENNIQVVETLPTYGKKDVIYAIESRDKKYRLRPTFTTPEDDRKWTGLINRWGTYITFDSIREDYTVGAVLEDVIYDFDFAEGDYRMDIDADGKPIVYYVGPDGDPDDRYHYYWMDGEWKPLRALPHLKGARDGYVLTYNEEQREAIWSEPADTDIIKYVETLPVADIDTQKIYAIREKTGNKISKDTLNSNQEYFYGYVREGILDVEIQNEEGTRFKLIHNGYTRNASQLRRNNYLNSGTASQTTTRIDNANEDGTINDGTYWYFFEREYNADLTNAPFYATFGDDGSLISVKPRLQDEYKIHYWVYDDEKEVWTDLTKGSSGILRVETLPAYADETCLYQTEEDVYRFLNRMRLTDSAMADGYLATFNGLKIPTSADPLSWGEVAKRYDTYSGLMEVDDASGDIYMYEYDGDIGFNYGEEPDLPLKEMLWASIQGTWYLIWDNIRGSGSGVDSYSGLSNKPMLNSVILEGNKNTEDVRVTWYGTQDQYDNLTDYDPTTIYIISDGDGTEDTNVDYTTLNNRPHINGVEVIGDKNSEELRISWIGTQADYDALSEHYENTFYIITDGTSVVDDANYNNLSNKPSISGMVLTGNKSLSELDLYSRAEVDNMLASLRSIKVVGAKPTNPVANTLYYVGTGNPYHIYLYDSSRTEIDLGDSTVNFGDYQLKIDANLATNSKNIVGAINELNADIGSMNLTTTALDLTGAINELDADIGNLATLTTDNKSTVVKAINELDKDIGNLTALKTASKTSTVDAINEVREQSPSWHNVVYGDELCQKWGIKAKSDGTLLTAKEIYDLIPSNTSFSLITVLLMSLWVLVSYILKKILLNAVGLNFMPKMQPIIG